MNRGSDAILTYCSLDLVEATSSKREVVWHNSLLTFYFNICYDLGGQSSSAAAAAESSAGDLSSSQNSNSPKGCDGIDPSAKSWYCPQKPVRFVTSMSPRTCTWQARRSVDDVKEDPCGGKDSRTCSFTFRPTGCTAPSI